MLLLLKKQYKMDNINKYYELETKPIIGAAGGASLGGIFGGTGIIVGGLLGFFTVLGIVLYLFFYKKN